MLWRIVAEEFFSKNHFDVPIIIEKVSFKRATMLSSTEDNIFDVHITKTGHFEIHESGSLVVNGSIKGLQDIPHTYKSLENQVEIPEDILTLNRNDFYKHLYIRGQTFGTNFRKVVRSDLSGCFGIVEWCGNFDCFLENVLQLTTFGPQSKHVVLTTFINRIVIDPIPFQKMTSDQKGE